MSAAKNAVAAQMSQTATGPLAKYLPEELQFLEDHQKDIPRIAKDPKLLRLIDQGVKQIPTRHDLYHQDAREMGALQPESVHLVLTSPPYWTLKEYHKSAGQLGHIQEYDEFVGALDIVWNQCFKALVPGGRLICVVGDVCLSRKKNNGRHTVVPLHASIQEHCRSMGFDNLWLSQKAGAVALDLVLRIGNLVPDDRRLRTERGHQE